MGARHIPLSHFWPHIVYNRFERAVRVNGFGDGPNPVNTFNTEPQTLFADPLHVPASDPNTMTTGVNRDTLLTVDWLDLSEGPQVLQVRDLVGRYNSVQFTDRSHGTDSA